MNAKIGIGISVVVLAATLMLSGRGASAKIFNDKIVESSQTIDNASSSIMTSMAPAFGGQPVDLALVKSRHATARKWVEEALAEADSIPLPSKPSAKAFLDVYKSHLANQSQILKDFESGIAIIEDAAVAPAEKGKQIHSIVFAASTLQEADTIRIQQAQKAFASDFNLPLK